VVPAGICALAAIAALLPAIRAGRLSTIQAIATGRAPRSGRGYAAHRLFGRTPLPRPITIGLAAPFARPSRTVLTLAAVLLGATAVTFAVGLTSSLTRLLNGISHQQAEPVQIQMPGNGFEGGPKQIKVGPQHIKAGPPTRGPQVPTAKAEQAILAAVHSQPATLHVVAQADDSASVAGLSEQIPVTAFRGPATWTGYDLVNGHWYAGLDQVLAPTGFLTQTGTSVGDTISLSEEHNRVRVRIVGEIFDTHNRGLNLVTSWATLRTLNPRIAPDQFDVGLRPGTSANAYAHALNRRLGPNYNVELNTRKTAVVNAMIGLIGTLAALLAAVAALGVLNTVVLETRERVHYIGIFKAVGMTPRQTTAMAISWVAAIGLIAGVIAVPIGVALHHEILPAMAGSVGLRLPASFLTVYSTPRLFVLAFAGVSIAMVGALAPATWAAKIHTATALHTE
jgi:putative ABC transport system permease protein